MRRVLAALLVILSLCVVGTVAASAQASQASTSPPANSVVPFGSTPIGANAVSNPNAPIVGMASTRDGGGTWLVGSDGGVFSYGDAGFFGSVGSLHLNAPVVGMASTPDAGGYWLVARDGGIFTYGDAGFFGSAGALPLNAPVVGMAPTPDGGGYWLVAADGGIFSYGDANFFGSAGSLHLNAPVVGMASTPGGGGYWLVAADGGIFSYGMPPSRARPAHSPCRRPSSAWPRPPTVGTGSSRVTAASSPTAPPATSGRWAVPSCPGP